MTVCDIMHRDRTETSIEATSRAKRVVDALMHLQPTEAGTVEQFSPESVVAPHGRRESAERLVVILQQPVAVPTAPMLGMIGGFGDAAHQLADMSARPLVAPTPASFETQGRLASALPLVEPTLAPAALPHWPHGAQVQPRQPEARAYRTFVEVADWLGMTQEDTARLLGMGRTTPLAWRRGHEPRPARARRLYQTHALLSTLVRRLGREQALRWLAAGDPAPLDLIRQGDVTAADDLAEELIFGAAPSRERLGAWVEGVEATRPPAAALAQAQPRRIRRPAPRRRTR